MNYSQNFSLIALSVIEINRIKSLDPEKCPESPTVRLPLQACYRATSPTVTLALKGKYLLTKEDILKVVQDLEEVTKKKKTKKGGKKTKYILISSEEEEEQSVHELA
jgi:hypothetical protein